jgi:hypothetical protein
VTGNETRLANCGQLAIRSVDNLWITFIFRILKSIFWAVLEGERGGWCIIGVHCHRNAVWMTLLLSMKMIANSHYQILNKSTLKPSLSMPIERIKTARKGTATSYPYLPLRNPLGRAVGGILVPTKSQSIR